MIWIYYKYIFAELCKNNEVSDCRNEYWWNHCLDREEERIRLSDFGHKATFDLINEENRKAKADKVVGEIVAFLKEKMGVAVNIKEQVIV